MNQPKQKLDQRWFKEDRALPKDEREQAKEASEVALRNSTLMSRRLKAILEEEYEKCIKLEDDFQSPGWKKRILALNARRRTLREIASILP
jgi:hypothetical protein